MESIGTSGSPPALRKAGTAVARQLSGEQRAALAREAMRGGIGIAPLAVSNGVSRKFVYAQRHRAERAIDEAFQPEAGPDDVIGWLPVTKAWIKRAVLSSALECHGSVRGIGAHVQNITSQPIADGTVVNILHEAAMQAEGINAAQNLRGIRAGAHDEIFSQGVPVLAGVEPRSTFLYLLEPVAHRDEASWWVALAQKQEQQGLNLATSISDAAKGLRAGVKAAFPQIEQRADVLHALMELTELSSYLENRAYARLRYQHEEERRMARAKNHGRGQTRSKGLALARQRAHQAILLYDEMTLLIHWLTEILDVPGPALAERGELYDWLVAEMQMRAHGSHRIPPVVTYLKTQRDGLLAFVGDLDRQQQRIAEAFGVPTGLVRAIGEQFTLDPEAPRFEAIERQLHEEAGAQAEALERAVAEVLSDVLRASSAVENINSILRGYFFLRRSIGPTFLSLLQFYLNHRRFRRSAHPERVGKSPRELLSGQPHSHWLEMLGYAPVTLLN